MPEKVVLAYSGGLDTSIIIPWLKENYACDVIAFVGDVGQGDDLEAVVAKAYKTGASDVLVEDLREEFLTDYVFPAVRAGAVYEHKYLLGTSLARPVLAKHQAETARRLGATTVAHGCTGKGNDQVRFEVGTRALAPDLEIVAPAREWKMTREETVEYARLHDIPVEATKERIYSIDENLWGRAIECGAIEDPWVAPGEEMFALTVPTTTEAVEVTVGFVSGVPVSLEGERLDLVELIDAIGRIAGSTGFGRIDMVENRRVGIKSREIYECPASLALLLAHADLEALTLERDLAHEKARLEGRFAELVYDGMWFSPLREALSAFVASTQHHVTGEVRLRFAPGGHVAVVGRRSPVGLYDYGLATYDAADSFRHEDAEGYIRIYGLGVKTWASRQAADREGDRP